MRTPGLGALELGVWSGEKMCLCPLHLGPKSGWVNRTDSTQRSPPAPHPDLWIGTHLRRTKTQQNRRQDLHTQALPHFTPGESLLSPFPVSDSFFECAVANFTPAQGAEGVRLTRHFPKSAVTQPG